MIKLEIMGKTTESLLKTFEGYQKCVISVAFHPWKYDCYWFYYNMIKLWGKMPGSLINTFIGHYYGECSSFFTRWKYNCSCF